LRTEVAEIYAQRGRLSVRTGNVWIALTESWHLIIRSAVSVFNVVIERSFSRMEHAKPVKSLRGLSQMVEFVDQITALALSI